jgi:hypothetical protein
MSRMKQPWGTVTFKNVGLKQGHRFSRATRLEKPIFLLSFRLIIKVENFFCSLSLVTNLRNCVLRGCLKSHLVGSKTF